MIIKNADDKSHDIATLQSLLTHPQATGETRKRIEQEIRNRQAGMRGENEAAHEMKVHYGASRNWAILHDLRVVHDDLVAQIDHLVINRWLDMWVCESKHFSEGVAINEHGEFSAFFGSKPYGVPSPIEQNAKHIRILGRILDSGAVALPTRLGFTIKPELKSLVLVSKGARISRPATKIAGIECVIKNDQFFSHVDKAVDDNSVLSTAKIISSETLERVAVQIAALHTPLRFDWHARFGLDRNLPTPSAPAPEAVLPLPVATAPVRTTSSARSATAGTPVCRHCGSDRLSVQWGKFGYYFKCAACEGNTPIKLTCAAGHKEKVRKDGRIFFRECAECKRSTVIFENPG